MFQLATSYLKRIAEGERFSFLEQQCRKASCGYGKEVSLFQRGRIIRVHQANKTNREIGDSSNIGLIMVQGIIKA